MWLTACKMLGWMNERWARDGITPTLLAGNASPPLWLETCGYVEQHVSSPTRLALDPSARHLPKAGESQRRQFIGGAHMECDAACSGPTRGVLVLCTEHSALNGVGTAPHLSALLSTSRWRVQSARGGPNLAYQEQRRG